MQLSIPSATLKRSLEAVAPAVRAGGVPPVLTCVRAEAATGRLTVTGTDLEMAVSYAADAEVAAPGAAIWPYAALRRIAARSGGALAIEADATRVRVEAGGAGFQMPGVDPAEFPDPIPADAGAGREVPVAPLRGLLRRTLFAAAREHVRFATAAVLWQATPAGLQLVATDTQRLAIAGPVKVAGLEPACALVPVKALLALERLLAPADAALRLTLRPDDAFFRVGPATVYTRLVRGVFPPYRDVLPRRPAGSLSLPVGALRSAVSQVAVMTEGEGRRLALGIAPGRLTLDAQAAGTGRSRVTLPIDWDGPPAALALVPSHVTQLLDLLPADSSVRLEWTAPDRPVLFRHGPAYTYVVSPLE